ncbi:MAG: AAA family ATPase [Anaeromyxobacter sp.]|nr:AAA family ATPase [Anaeromyxobacter sp.]MBL0276104.1 AAA family ATPase [Anaeromyxobacter sp.]
MSALAGEVAELWAAGTPLVYLVTSEEERAVALCRAAAEGFDASLAVWSSQRGLDPLAPAARTPLAALEAVLAAPAPVLAVLLDFHLALRDPAVARAVRDATARLGAEGRCLVVVAPRLELPDGLHGEVAVLRLPLPDEAELAATLAAAQQAQGAPPLPTEARHRALTAARGLSEGQARRAFTRAFRQDPTLGLAAAGVILDEKKRLLARDLGLEVVESGESADDLGGLSAFKGWLDERAQAFAPGAAAFGLPAPRGVLLVGVQGCGKSLAAKAAASRLGVPLLRLDLPRVLGREGAEESLATALEAAEAVSPAALWVDEIEKGFAGSAPGQGGEARAARLLGAFSTWLQERKGSIFVVATANDVTRLPPELLRRGRFDELFFVDLPDLEARREILTLHLVRRARQPGSVDLTAIAELCADYSGAELEQVVVGGLHRAYALKRDLETADLRRVAQDLVPLFKTYEEQVKALREWARGRARVAGRSGAVVDLFRRAPPP